MKSILYIFLCLGIFTACSQKTSISKTQSIQTTKVQITNTKNSIEDNFDDEFSDFDDEYTKEKKEVFDPLSGYNRVMTSFNDFVYMNFLRHIVKGYSYIVPEIARIGISNVLKNLGFPVRFANNLLQLKIKNATEELGRFALNSTFGLAGLFDVAKNRLNWEEHNEDFGQTLGFYGLGEGFPIVLPILGPSNPRDILAFFADGYVSALNSTSHKQLQYKIPHTFTQTVGIKAVDSINDLSFMQGQYESLRKDALDLYPFLRDIYHQKRQQEIKE